MYNQPNVEVTEFIAGGQALCGSPAGISGGTGNGTTGDIGSETTPIPGD